MAENESNNQNEEAQAEEVSSEEEAQAEDFRMEPPREKAVEGEAIEAPQESQDHHQEFEAYSDVVSEEFLHGFEHNRSSLIFEQYRDFLPDGERDVEAPVELLDNNQEYERYRDSQAPIAVNRPPLEAEVAYVEEQKDKEEGNG